MNDNFTFPIPATVKTQPNLEVFPIPQGVVVPTIVQLTQTDCAPDWIIVSSGALPGVYGGYVELITASAFASTWFSLHLETNQATFNVEAGFDWATGAAGFEVPFYPNFGYGWQGPLLGGACSPIYYGGAVIPALTRISVRVKDDNAAVRPYRLIGALYA